MRQYRPYDPKYHQRKKLTVGSIVLLFGALLLLETLHIIPGLHYTVRHFWPFLLIAVGLVIGIRTGFQRPTSWILMFIGVVNIIPAFMVNDVPSTHLIWPAALILAGAVIILRRKTDNRPWRRDRNIPFRMPANENALNIDVTFGGQKEIVTTKDFKGGRVQATFGGTEINLMQAEIQQSPVTLDIQVTFGGVELIVPSSWDVKNEIRPTLGSYEDNRVVRPPDSAVNTKILTLRGSCTFGSIEVKSY